MSSTLNRIGIFSVVSKIYTTKINFVGVLDTIFFFHLFTFSLILTRCFSIILKYTIDKF